MDQLFPLIAGFLALAVGSVLGYYARQSIAKRDYRTIESRLQKKISQAKIQSEEILAGAQKEAEQILETTKKETNQQRAELFKTERLLLKRENILEGRLSTFETEKNEFQEKVKKLREIKETLENLKTETISNLERISGLTREDAKKELLGDLEKEYQKEILERMRKLELDGRERFEKRAKEILAQTIQKCALSQAQEITTTTLTLPSEEIKGRIIGKEGRNIRTLEKLTGVEIVVDETPEAVVISGFDPIRRQIARSALEKLIQDGRIQPARIEEKVEFGRLERSEEHTSELQSR